MQPKDYNPDFTRKLGGSVELFRTRQGIQQIAGQNMVDMNSNLFQESPQERLLTGSWVATVRTQILEDDVTSTANPAVVLVEFGEGGTNTSFEVSPGPGATFAVASGQVRIAAYLPDADGGLRDNFGGVLQGSPIIPPIRQRVSCFIKRSAQDGQTRRVFYRALTPVGLAIGGTLAGDVPKFARSIYVTSPDAAIGPVDVYDPANALNFTTSNALNLVSYNGQQLWDAIRAGVPLPVPVGAERFVFTAGVAIAGGVVGFEFHQEI